MSGEVARVAMSDGLLDLNIMWHAARTTSRSRLTGRGRGWLASKLLRFLATETLLDPLLNADVALKRQPILHNSLELDGAFRKT